MEKDADKISWSNVCGTAKIELKGNPSFITAEDKTVIIKPTDITHVGEY